ncbi:2-aminoethylphosphonate ABC transporter substrate-binding protein [Phytomonospora endophytica]|uniref:2-aminoethylphosphonate transport system substrate-binding protein n=1 Tax=Phytomonospora endophytica TaxID=714109 RepID=A0A841FVH5_9ACTN|nr:2-aminoethylphosphonate ABC transporter substrate-binding protein [Phytomonospora endophytica]MBB6035980.1 2-aminoethylphosphonate transport system substrate-binding protein [Phytomonospora endophytica]GIG66886.1 putative ABC transporter, periplasmic protein [Phytomonospora endophytica]
MRRRLLAAALIPLTGALAACGGTGSADAGDDKTVTVYSVDGLADWYTPQFAAFTAQTGIAVELVESGSGEVVSRLQQEKANTQADVAVTLPPYIQKAEAEGLLAAYTPAGADKTVGGSANYTPLVNNYLCFIHNPAADPAPSTWDSLLDARFKGKLQYSTPGQAGDGTAVLIQLQHELGKQGALDYLAKLEESNVGPSSSTGKLQPKVSKGEILVANGDVQMNLASIHNDGSRFEIFFPAGADGKRSTFAIPYFMGLADGAPHGENGRKLMDFLLSPEAQQQVSLAAYGIPARGDVTATDENFAAVQKAMEGVEIWQPDWTRVLADLDADVAAYLDAVGQS